MKNFIISVIISIVFFLVAWLLAEAIIRFGGWQ